MYKTYIDYVTTVVQNKKLENFKSNDTYREILEHVSQQLGLQYYNVLRTTHNINRNIIEDFCSQNDKIGSPVKYSISDMSFPVSPTSLRYIDHAVKTLNHIQSIGLNSVNIVEVGCGYGGLLLAIDYMSKLRGITIASYSCVDIDSVTSLQELYLSNYNLSFPVTFHSASTFGNSVAGNNLFLVSMYCFSEIEPENQKGYIKNLIPHVKNGIFMWNHCDVFDFGKPILSIQDEQPLTGRNNKLVLF